MSVAHGVQQSGGDAAEALPNGEYLLANPPDGRAWPGGHYGERMARFQGQRDVLFDFNADGADMRLVKAGHRVAISGTALALRPDGAGGWTPWDYWQIDFVYEHGASYPEDGDG